MISSTRVKKVIASAFFFLFLGEFDSAGVLAGEFSDSVNPIAALKISITQSSDNWIILSEVQNAHHIHFICIF